ncbi:YciI family protein [Janibacter sp. G56]|uniref:YciI family protein n=1 Tax=Janibacter sp. G56 TaxID=3418717 RepID=UPI003CFBEC39
MAHFVLEYRYADMDARAQARPAHLAYMNRLHAEGKVVLAGPIGDGSGAMVIFRAADEAEVQGLVAADPYTVQGVSADATIRPWKVVIPDHG